MQWTDEEPGSDALEVKVAELLVATADEADFLVDPAVSQVLKLLREKLNMDVVFVSEFTGGQRVFRHVEQAPGSEVIAVGGADPLEASWCQRVVDGRLPEFIPDAAPLQASGQAPATPFRVGTHLSTAIVLGSGKVYGTLCCFSFGSIDTATERDLNKLRYTAQLTADRIDRSHRKAADLALEPLPDKGFSGRL